MSSIPVAAASNPPAQSAAAGAGLAALDDRVALKGLLGRGGMGKVHRAWDARLERPVAVKFLRADDAHETERLLLEARLQARVQHRHVVQVLEVGTLAGRPCIVLQLVEGPSLAQLAPELDLPTKVLLLRQAAEGLHAAHRQGLIHRDVKPGNVLVERPPEGGPPTAFVGDFGLARDDEGGLTRTGVPAGTIDFMSPEQLLGHAPLDHRADVYALGATLYAVLAGRPPFRLPTSGDDPSSALQRILQEPPPPLPHGTPRDLARVVARALEKAPNDRYQSAQELADDLDRFQRGEPVLARAAPLGERALRWSRRNPIAARAVGLAALAVIAGGGVATWATQRSAQAVLDAGRWAADAEALDLRMTLEKLLPVHDLRPAQAELRAALARARSGEARRASGPAAFLEGRAHQLLGENDAALEALGRAWDGGYRLPEVAYALALAEAERFRLERERLRAVEDPALAAAALHEAERRWRDPALSRLAAQSGRGDVLGRLAKVLVASLEDHHRQAGDLAHALAVEAPAQVEALELGLDARWAEASDAVNRGDRDQARRLTEAALLEGEAALAVARSSIGLRVSMARLQFLLDLSGPGEAAFEAQLGKAEHLVEEALQLDPGSGPALQLASTVATVQARHHAAAGRPYAQDVERAMAAAARATEVAPENIAAWEQAVWAALNAVFFLKNAGQDVTPQVEWGLSAARRVHELSPGPARSSHEAQLLLLRAGFAHERGEPAGADADRAIALADELIAGGRQPLTGRYVKSSALLSRAQAACLSGGDPDPDFRSALELLREVHRRWPDEPRYESELLGLLNEWARQAIQDGREDVPLEEAEPRLAAALAANPDNSLVRSAVGDLRAFRGLFDLRRGERARGDASYRAGIALLRSLLPTPFAPTARGDLAGFADARAWITRAGPDVTEAEARAREYLAAKPGSSDGRLLLGSVLLLRAELAPAPARAPLLAEALAALEAASRSGATGPVLLALRGRVKERLQTGAGAEDLAAARRMDPRLAVLSFTL